MNDERHYTTEQVSQMIGVTDARVRQMAIASNGAIGRKWGRDWVFTDADLDRMRQRNTAPGPRGPRRKEGDG